MCGEASSIYLGENAGPGEEQRQQSWGAADAGGAQYRAAGGGGQGQSEPVPALHSALSAAAGAGTSNGLCWLNEKTLTSNK